MRTKPRFKENADVEFDYFVDTVVGDTPSAIRVFSQTKDISTFELVRASFLRNQVKWRLPKRWLISTRLVTRFV